MMWKSEPQPAHWRIRSQHVTRQESRIGRFIYLGIMFPVYILVSALLVSIFAILFILFYTIILIFLPVYGTTGFCTIWSLHFLKRSTDIGPGWLKESPSGYIEEKARGFQEIIKFAFTWHWTEVDELNKQDDYFVDPKGPYTLYTYKTLPVQNEEQEIRVLDLLPGHRDSPIRCRIRHVSLKHNEPAYEAISYCWGGEKPSIPVYVDDADKADEGPRQILVTKNLVQALQQFRQSNQERTVWADAICINQEQNPEAKDECSRQVKLMGRIYQKAQHCLVWLNRGTKEAENYTNAIKELVQLERDFISSGITENPLFLSPEEKARHKIPHGQTSHLRGLQMILSHVWLTRVWIVQEASLAQRVTIYLGSGSVAWDDLISAQSFASRIGLLHSESEAPVNGILAIRCNRFFQDSRLPLKGEGNILALFARFRNFDASNAKDKVYGLISLLTEEHHSQWPVGLEAEQAYSDAAKRILSGAKSLDLLGIPRLLDPPGHSNGEKPEVINVPTWVPDWRSNQVPISLRMLEFAPCERKYAATKDSTYDINLSADESLLGVDAYRISIIRELGDLHHYRPVQTGLSTRDFMRIRVKNLMEMVNTYFSWRRTVQVCDNQASYPHSTTPMSAREAFWRTIIAYEPTRNTVSADRLAESFEAFDTMMDSIRKLRPLIKLIPLVVSVHGHWLGRIFLNPFQPFLTIFYSNMAQDPEAQDFCNDMVIAFGRKIARTDDGHFALVPGNARVGDEITLLKGARAPIVLRKHFDDDHWEHVGETYVEGLMNGEQWNESLCERRWLA